MNYEITAAPDTSSIVTVNGREVGRFYVNPFGGGYRAKVGDEVREFGKAVTPKNHRAMMTWILSHA